ncbi:MAG TPA: hypothetical protein VES69_03335, partial [Pyrinomonadaceae bacterium]|nr:hypothetical protein [Pyrinomonadaceae bacterium]
NVRVRRASRALTKANDLRELFDAVTYLLESGEFAHACMQMGHPAGGEVNERAVEASEKQQVPRDLELRNGRIFWSWSRSATEADDVADSGSFWCLRLPLTTASGQWGWINLYRAFDTDPLLIDMNYLSELFRGQLSEATAKILQKFAEEPARTSELRMAVSAGKILS